MCEKVCVPSTMTVAAASTLTVTGVCIVPETTTVENGKEHSEAGGRLNDGRKSEQKVNVEDSPSQKEGQRDSVGQKDSHGQNKGSKPSEVQVSNPSLPKASNQRKPKSSEVKAENNAKGEGKSGNSENGNSRNGNSRNGNSGNGNSANGAKVSTANAGPNSTAKPTIEPFVNAASKNALGACVLGFAALLL